MVAVLKNSISLCNVLSLIEPTMINDKRTKKYEFFCTLLDRRTLHKKETIQNG